MEEELINISMDAITPVIESSMVVAGAYAKACGRPMITAEDVEYGMKYSARTVAGNVMGTLFPELDDDDDEEMEFEDEDDAPFVRYVGDNTFARAVNEAVDTWSAWEPESPVDCMLKNAIDTQYVR